MREPGAKVGHGHEWETGVGHVTRDAARRFLSIDTCDQFRWKVVRGVAAARDFNTVNTGTSDQTGFYWVSVLYFIEKMEEDHGTQPGTEEAHTPAASSQRRLNATGSTPSGSLVFLREDGQPDPTAPWWIRTT